MLNGSYISLLKVSVPVMLGMLIQFSIFITDAAFLGRLDSSLAFNAVSTAGLIILTLTSICYGLYFGTQILIAKYLGKDNTQISGLFYNSFVSLFVLGALMFVLTLIISNFFLDIIVADTTLQLSMKQFMNSRAWGFWFSITGFAFLAFYTGVARTQFLVWSSLIVAFTNILLDYGLIFGKLGFPEMGMIGASWASNIAEVVGFLFGLIYISYDNESKTILKSAPLRISKIQIRAIFSTSTPLMLQGMLATFGWAVFFLLIEKLGQEELEVSQVVRNIYYIILVPIIGFSSTTKTYVSNYMSHNASREELLSLIKRLCLLSFLSVLIITSVGFVFPKHVISLITNKEHVIENTIPILRFISVAMLEFSITLILLNIIAGAGKTLATMTIEAITVVIYVVASIYVTIINYQSLLIVWSMEYLYFTLIGVFSIVYIYTSKLLRR